MSDFKELYKSRFMESKGLQAERRIKLLEEQRKKREENFLGHRNITSVKFKKWKKKCKTKDYRNVTMLSEWMMEMPDDLENFFLVACPKGIRCTLSNEKYRNCTLYYKNGAEFLNVKANVPKGTVLDCIYSEPTLYVLDVMKYDNREFIECDTAFRSYWIKNKFIEDDLKIYESSEKCSKLQLIEMIDFADSNMIQKCFQTFPLFEDNKELDGFLFYHKEASYTFGQTPLVLWLFGFMIEEVLPMFRVHQHYNEQKPENYISYLDYICDFNIQLKIKRRRYRNRIEKENMDVEDIENNEEQEPDEMQKMINLEKYGDFE
ncbi:snurportin-1 [Chironomus tepperi]|uniref:snurportin-1 n=1 Tax=Chironomus tepperi TaxID=113505 RepID=UPI00391FAAC3